MTETFITAIPVNPEPWKAPMKGRGHAFSDKGSIAYKGAIRDHLERVGATQLEPPYRVHFLFWRKRFQYLDKRGAKRTRNAADATNMQKLTEDALQGILIDDDVRNRYVTSQTVAQGLDVEPMVIVMVAHIDDPGRIRIPEGFTEGQILDSIIGCRRAAVTSGAEQNDWAAEEGII